MDLKTVCVYCGSNPGADPAFGAAAVALGRVLARDSITLVYGGAGKGLMGTLADTVLAEGGRVVGIMPEHLVRKEVAHHGLTEFHVVDSMHTRKARMAELSDGFVALPGGLGTLEEICETLTWSQLGLMSKPCGFLNVSGYYDHLRLHLDRMTEMLFMRPQHRALALMEEDPETLLSRFREFAPPTVSKWLEEKS